MIPTYPLQRSSWSPVVVAVNVDSYDEAMRHRLRTLLIVLALGPMVLAWAWWLLWHEIGLAVLFVLAAVTLYGLFAFGTGFAIAWVINGINVLIAKLQGRR